MPLEEARQWFRQAGGKSLHMTSYNNNDETARHTALDAYIDDGEGRTIRLCSGGRRPVTHTKFEAWICYGPSERGMSIRNNGVPWEVVERLCHAVKMKLCPPSSSSSDNGAAPATPKIAPVERDAAVTQPVPVPPPEVRGSCGQCRRPVTTYHLRVRRADGSYDHLSCARGAASNKEALHGNGAAT